MGDNRLGAIKVLRAIGSLLQLSCASAVEVVKCWGAKLGVGGTGVLPEVWVVSGAAGGKLWQSFTALCALESC